MSDEPVTASQRADGSVQTWGALQILEEVGSGGFGRVYRAWEPTLARDVALKIIRPRALDPQALAAILREGQLLARVRHPNVVTIYGAQQIGDEVGLWMEFVRGKSLAQLVTDDGPRAASEAVVIGMSVCQALAAVHQADVLHRDIKASNVMRESANGRIVLMDFGAGQILEGKAHAPDGLVGTLPYMAPEVLGGAPASKQSDIYSLGVLLYFLVSRRYPVEGRRATDFLLAHARSERCPLGDLRPDVPADFVRVVERATALHPDERYATAGAMLQALSRLSVETIALDPTTTFHDSARLPAPPAQARPRRLPMVLAVVAGALVGLWALGAVTSIAFNHTLGREAAYRGESVLTWVVWGVMALVPPTIKVSAVLLIAALVRAVTKVVTHASKPAADISKSLHSHRRTLATRLGLDDAEAAANALLAVEILAVAVFCWHFRDILGGVMTFIDTAAPDALDAMHPRHYRRHQYYDFIMGLLIFCMVLSTRRMNDLRRQAGAALRSSFALSLAVLAAALIILVLPFRILWFSELEMATVSSRECFILGERIGAPGPSLLVYCPGDQAPRIHKLAPEEVRRLGKPNDIYCLNHRPCR